MSLLDICHLECCTWFLSELLKSTINLLAFGVQQKWLYFNSVSGGTVASHELLDTMQCLMQNRLQGFGEKCLKVRA